MSGLISREAAIDALKRLQKDISGDYTELGPMAMAGCGYIGDCIGEIQDLPSAEQERCMDETKVQIGDEVLLDIGTNPDWYISTIWHDKESFNVEMRRKTDYNNKLAAQTKTQKEELPSAELTPCDLCMYNGDCEDMRIYCPARGRTE